MRDFSTSFVGVSLRDYLLRESGLDIREFRFALDAAALKDLKAFWTYKKLGTFPENRARQIIADSLAGGQLGKRRVKLNLEKTNSIEVLNSNLNLLSAEIVAFFAPKAKQLNFARFQIRCVKAHLEIIGNLEEQVHLQGVGKSEIKNFQLISDELMQQKIKNQRNLEQWIDKCHDLLKIISQKFPEELNINNDESYMLSSRLKKGFISQKNLPTYYKHWKNYCFNKLSEKVELYYQYDENSSLKKITKELEKTETITSYDIEQRISSNLELQEHFMQSKNNNAYDASLMEREFDLDNRTLKIRHNKSSLAKNLINPLIANIKTQFIIKPNMETLNTSITNEGNLIEIKLEKPKKTDINLIEEILSNL